ncbi:MAG: L-serine ammonia-lyase, iron-sulfur-dependent, subunit alpha [Eubacterium sp.]|nr:L-serine ammonia-lyase, iron-sulfur-dependent, subunit alpha [Eubacterium sp.]
MFEAVKDILKEEKEKKSIFWKVVMENDCRENGYDQKESWEKMHYIYGAMRESEKSYSKDMKSRAGLSGSAAYKLEAALEKENLLLGDFIGSTAVKALKIAESNACMRKIVAAPTAGSCGVVSAVFLAAQERLELSDEKMTEAMYVAAGIGGVIAARASLSGAAGGCQAEIGAASSMAAAGLAYLMGGNSKMIANAAALAMKNMLGLACDPVAGLVEVPCVKRNVSGAVNAVTSAQLALAGIKSAIPADEVFDAMNAIGRGMDSSIRETGNGGLAATLTGKKIKEKMKTLM